MNKIISFLAMMFICQMSFCQTDTKIYNLAEIEKQPSFPGGDSVMYKWIDDNLRYHFIDAGTVVVQFIIEKDGTVSNPKVVSGKNPLLDSEALRLFRNMPSWVPGMHNEQNVRVYYTLPIRFNQKDSKTYKVMDSDGSITPPEVNGGFYKMVSALTNFNDNAMEQLHYSSGGTLYVKFLISEEGRVSEPELIGSISKTIDNQVKGLFNQLHQTRQWTPAKYNGHPCCTECVFEYKFKRMEEGVSMSILPHYYIISAEKDCCAEYLIDDDNKKTYIALNRDGYVFIKYEGKVLGRNYSNDNYTYWGEWEKKENVDEIKADPGYLSDEVHRLGYYTVPTINKAVVLTGGLIGRDLYLKFPCSQLTEFMQRYHTLYIDRVLDKIYGARCKYYLVVTSIIDNIDH